MRSGRARNDSIRRDRYALLVATPKGELQFATRTARSWLKRYFGRPARAGLLPRKVCRWLAADQEMQAAKSLLVRGDKCCLLVYRLRPHPEDSITLLMETERNSDGGEGRRRHGPLTTCENEVLRRMATGRSNREIAESLQCATGTVGKHVEHIFRKLGVRNRTAATKLYFEGERFRAPTDAARAIA